METRIQNRKPKKKNQQKLHNINTQQQLTTTNKTKMQTQQKHEQATNTKTQTRETTTCPETRKTIKGHENRNLKKKRRPETTHSRKNRKPQKGNEKRKLKKTRNAGNENTVPCAPSTVHRATCGTPYTGHRAACTMHRGRAPHWGPMPKKHLV